MTPDRSLLGNPPPPAVLAWRWARRVWARWAERGVAAILGFDVDTVRRYPKDWRR